MRKNPNIVFRTTYIGTIQYIGCVSLNVYFRCVNYMWLASDSLSSTMGLLYTEALRLQKDFMQRKMTNRREIVSCLESLKRDWRHATQNQKSSVEERNPLGVAFIWEGRSCWFSKITFLWKIAPNPLNVPIGISFMFTNLTFALLASVFLKKEDQFPWQHNDENFFLLSDGSPLEMH